jgi:ADP-ribose pyrophosphatase YjhB (NUDIX family)
VTDRDTRPDITAAPPGADGHLGAVRELVGTHLLVVPGVAAAVIDGRDRLLLVRHAATGWWVLPGGAVEPDEQPADAVVRETREETGVEARPTHVVAVDGGAGHHIRYPNGDEVSYVTTVFRCEPVGGRLDEDSDEVTAVRWVPRTEVADLEGLAPWLERLLSHLDREVAHFVPPGR